MWKEHKILDNHPEHFDGNLDFQHRASPVEEKTEEPLSSPFSHLDNLTNTGNPLNGDSFWQYKSPVRNNEVVYLTKFSLEHLYKCHARKKNQHIVFLA